MKTNDNNRSNNLPEKYKVPLNEKLEELKWNRNAGITGLLFVFFLFELFLIIDEDNLEEGAFVGLTFLCFGPSFAIFIAMVWFGTIEEIRPLEEKQGWKEENMVHRIQNNKRNARNCEEEGRYDKAIKIWDDLGQNYEVERIKGLKVKSLYEKLKRHIEILKEKGVDCTQLEEELATLEKTLDNVPTQDI
jgi:hypothetical protein|tara:strand:- start:418 stop:987 length:570 start_codon:yes stop_codon:yes gene_type:complete